MSCILNVNREKIIVTMGNFFEAEITQLTVWQLTVCVFLLNGYVLFDLCFCYIES